MANLDDLRRPVEQLARLDRASCSPGERQAALWIADALRERGAQAEVEEEVVHGTYWWPLGLTSALGGLAALLGRRGKRLLGLALGAAGAALVVDELGVRNRWLRRALPKQRTTNVVAQAGDLRAHRTVVLVAHHDAAHSGFFFNPRIEEGFGRLVRRGVDSPASMPGLMVPIAVAPAVAGVGAALGLRRTTSMAGLVCAGIITSFVDIALRPTVPGANDNLTGVSTLLAVADELRDDPPSGLKLLLVSTGAEESLMEGMEAFAERHFPSMPREATTVICIDTVGSPHLVLAEAEGMLEIRRHDEQLKELIAECARTNGLDLLRGMTMRFGTDGYVALRHGYRAATLMSVAASGAASNYHWPTDTPDRVSYGNVAAVVELCLGVVRRLADPKVPAPAFSA
jgi:hypothetical protein